MNKAAEIIPLERIQNFIFLIRGEKVLIDQQLAELYRVPTKVLIQAVKRNQERFPDDFAFQLTRQELAHLRSQIVTSNVGPGGRRYLPYAFTEQGVAMLSSVLRSKRAVQVNVAIMRAFVSLRRLLATNETLARKFAELERRLESHDKAVKSLFDAIRELMQPPAKPKREIGFHAIAREHKHGIAKKTRTSCSQTHREIRHLARAECEVGGCNLIFQNVTGIFCLSHEVLFGEVACPGHFC